MRNKMKTMIIAARAEKPKDMPVHVTLIASTKMIDGKKVKIYSVSGCCMDKEEIFTDPDAAMAAAKKNLMAKPKPEEDDDEYEMED